MALTTSLLERVGVYDVVVITAPLLPSTRGLISYDVMKGMKENATLVNIARGGLIDQEGLITVFTERKDMFAAVDVFENEPLEADSPLWRMDNVAISPHNSFVSDRNNERMFDVMYQHLKDFIGK